MRLQRFSDGSYWCSAVIQRRVFSGGGGDFGVHVLGRGTQRINCHCSRVRPLTGPNALYNKLADSCHCCTRNACGDSEEAAKRSDKHFQAHTRMPECTNAVLVSPSELKAVHQNGIN